MKQKTKKAFSFLQNAIKDSISKFHYYECDQKGMHNGQKLTYVCINRHCRSRRLICSICKEDHISHDADVIPLKFFICQIDEIKDTLPKSYALEKDTREYLETLDQKKNQLLYALRQTVQKLALYFQNLQQQIINQFQSTKIKLLNEISLNRNLRNQIDELLENLDGDQKAFQKGIDKISACAYRTGKKNQIDFKSHLPEFLDKYRTYSHKTLLKLNQILSANTSHFENQLSTQIDTFSSQPKLASVKKQIKTFQPVPFLSKQLHNDQTDLNKEEIKAIKELSSYSFSTLLKSNSILVEKNGLMAKQTKSGSAGRFVLVTEGVGIKNQQISFKMTRLSDWIGIGICIRDKIAKVKYAFQYEKLGHGSYLLSSNGFTWSHSELDQNIKDKSFILSQGQIIDVHLTETELKFVKRISQQTLKLKINMNKTQWSNVCFCANLCDAEDKVQIIRTPNDQLNQKI